MMYFYLTTEKLFWWAMTMKNNRKPQPQRQEKLDKSILKTDKIRKQIDRVRKSVKALEKAGLTNSPAYQSALRFMYQYGINSINQTKWIKTQTQLQNYLAFLKNYETHKTRNVKVARQAKQKQDSAVSDILKDAGFDAVDEIQLNHFYGELNKLDIYALMNELGLESNTVMRAIAMTTKNGKRLSVNRIVQQIYGGAIKGIKASEYRKGTPQNLQKHLRRKNKKG